MKIWALLLAGFALGSAVVAEETDVWSKTINNDSNGTWNVWPDKPKAKVIKVEELKGGHAFRIQATAAPWTSTMDMTSKITAEWHSYCAHRVASATLPKSSVSIHLAAADQVIELGPVFVFNLGKRFPENQLKGCDG